jgi:hypothetical protein
MDDTPPTRTAEPDLPPDADEEHRPDLKAAPESPPAEKVDVERGQEKLERVISK